MARIAKSKLQNKFQSFRWKGEWLNLYISKIEFWRDAIPLEKYQNSLIIKLVTLKAIKRKIISKSRTQRFCIALLASYHLLLNTSHLIFHFFTIPCLRQHFYPLGILVFKINEVKSFTFWRTKLKGWNLHLQFLSSILHLSLSMRKSQDKIGPFIRGKIKRVLHRTRLK